MAAPIASFASPVVYHVASTDTKDMSAEVGQDLPALVIKNAVDDTDTVLDMLVLTRDGRIVLRGAVANGTGAGQWSVRETT